MGSSSLSEEGAGTGAEALDVADVADWTGATELASVSLPSSACAWSCFLWREKNLLILPNPKWGATAAAAAALWADDADSVGEIVPPAASFEGGGGGGGACVAAAPGGGGGGGAFFLVDVLLSETLEARVSDRLTVPLAPASGA